MPNTEKNHKTLADQLQELTDENAPKNAPNNAYGGSEESIADMTEALRRLASDGKLQEPDLQFIDGASSPIDGTDIDESTAIELITQSLIDANADFDTEFDGELPENPMIVGEVEQLPILGLEADAATAEEEVEAQPTEFIDNDKLISIVESLLFATDKPVSIATMKVLFKGSNIRTKDIQRALDGLASSYAAADRGVSVEEIHGGYQLRTKVDNTEYLKRLAKVRPFRLSGPALEVLAIAAYKQPITKTEVDQIRGVESGHLMRALMERGMVGFGEKSDLPGRPMTYVTTRKFLETFGLRNIKELPTLAEIDQLLPEGIGEEEEKETLSSVTDALSKHIGSTYSEGEAELGDISESLKAIDTTSEFFEQEKVRQRVERDREKAQDLRDKITFGDEVEDKDRRWLSRYEAKQEQIAQAAESGLAAGPLIVEEDGEAPFVVNARPVDVDPDVSEELAALSSEGVARTSASGESEGIGEDDMTDELAVNPDFSDDDVREDVDGDV